MPGAPRVSRNCTRLLDLVKIGWMIKSITLFTCLNLNSVKTIVFLSPKDCFIISDALF